MQREREAEGDEFADKDKFVTQAYKDQMAEVRKAEEEERAREGMLCPLFYCTSGSNHSNHSGATAGNNTLIGHDSLLR